MTHRKLLALAALLLAVIPARAQSGGVVANIPFTFHVGQATLPAGQYTLEALGISSPTVELRNTADTRAMFLMVCACASDNVQHGSELVFHKYGNRYFLWQIWTGENDVGSQLLTSRREHEIEQAQVAGSASSTTIASLVSVPARDGDKSAQPQHRASGV